MPRYRTVASGVRADARRGVAVATGALAAVAIVELIATLVEYTGPLKLGAVVRLVALDATLLALAWVIAAPLAAAGFALPRLGRRIWRGRDEARGWAGPGVAPVPGRWVAVAWGFVLVAGAYVWWSTRATFAATEKYKEYRLMSTLLAIRQVVVVAILAAVGLGLGAVLDRARTKIDALLARRPALRVANPIGHPVAATAVAVVAVVVVLMIAGHKMPPLRPLIPWRWMLDGLALAAGAGATLELLRRRALLPADRPRRRRLALASAAVALVLVPATLLRLGGHVDTKGMAVSASPLLEKLIALVRTANDLDRDGFGSLLGENDCAPLDPKIRPGARDEPDNGIDENCNGRDASLRDLVAPVGDKMPVPEAFVRDWNVLLLTIDTVRYDHTGFGGYGEKRGRDTTPHLDELVERSVSFTFANSPSAGTMASVPAIITSKFFHSGIALDEKRKPKMPPKLKAENTTLPEIMKKAGYRTGAILSHEYFNDWGMSQGVDDYDNEIGKKPDAFRISSDDSTDRAIAWISSHARKKWFLWVHYLDPHGRYVGHPEGPSWGDKEEDLYDGELRYTDEHVGRLLTELARLPGADRTIVIITSDHGDGFNEHGFTNHGQALYRELLHVPLIFYVPDLPSREVGGAVTPLDIIPTIADLCGIDVSHLTFEGRSLVPQLFYGKADPGRVVYAETNYPKPLRAAVSQKWKLIYDLSNNLYQLFDLEADPWEKSNLASKNPQALADMKEHLDGWLERVMFARDSVFNQATAKVADVLLTERPKPANPVEATSFDDGAIEVIGYAPDPSSPAAKPGEKMHVLVYFAVKKRPSGPHKLQLSAWLTDRATFDPGAAPGKRAARSSMRVTAEGYLPADRWRPGEFIRERFAVTVPGDWAHDPGDAVVLSLAIQAKDGKLPAAGRTPAGEPTLAVLGLMPIERPASLPPPQNPGKDAGVAPTAPLAPVPARPAGARDAGSKPRR